MDNGTHFSGERHAIGAEVETDPNREVIPVVCDDDGHLIVNISGTTPVVDIGIVQIEDSAGNPLTSTTGSLNVNITGGSTADPDVNIHDAAGNPISSTGTSLNVDITNTVPVTGPLTDTQLRATPVPISGTVTTSPPANASTNLTQVGGAAITEGQKTMANSVPVVIASDQSAIAVTGTITTSPNVNVHDGSGNTIASTGTSLNVDVTNTVPVTLTSTTITGNVTVVQPTGTNLHTVVDSGTITLSGTSPVSGTVTANQGTANTPANKWPIEIVDSAGVNIATVSAAGAVKVDGSAVTQPVSGTVTANAGSGTFAVSAASLPLPTGAATSANQTNATQKTQIVDGSGNVIASTTNALNVDVINTIPVTFPTDVSPATQNITVVDSGTSTATGANGQSLYTGTPTAGSAASFTISSQESVGVQVSGTWTGTLQLESSIDGGTTWSKNGGHQKGVTFNSSSFTANFEVESNVSTATNFRVRATAAMTGTAVVKIVTSFNGNATYILNALQILDGGTTGTKATIKAASTGPASTDTSLVVALSPNLPVTVSTVGITASSSGDNTVIAAQGVGKRIYVFAWNISFSGSVNAKFTDGAAGTLFSGLYYGIVNAGGGNAVPPPYYLWVGTANTALVLNLSGATAVGGSVSYYVI